LKNDLYPIGLVRQQMRRRGNTGREMVSAPSLFMLPDANKNKLFANKYLCSRQNNMKYVPHTSPYVVSGADRKSTLLQIQYVEIGGWEQHIFFTEFEHPIK
jgi:hypothetical protein